MSLSLPARAAGVAARLNLETAGGEGRADPSQRGAAASGGGGSGRRGRRLSADFPLARQFAAGSGGAGGPGAQAGGPASAGQQGHGHPLPTQVAQLFDVHPQLVANKLMAVAKLAAQLDRVVGPRHPLLLRVGAAMAQAAGLRAELEAMGYLLVLEETAGLQALRKRPPPPPRG